MSRSSIFSVLPLSILLLPCILGLELSACGVTAAPTPSPTGSVGPIAIKPQPMPPAPTSLTAVMEPTPTSPPPTDLPAASNPTLRRVPTLSPLAPGVITHGDRSQPFVALTFDACQDPDQPADYDAAIINILTETNTPATLFLGGLWMQRYPVQTQALAANPLFEVGNHAWSHPNFTRLSPEEMSAEILRTQQLVYRLTGQQATLFRFPFDVYNDQAVAVVGQHGLRVISADVVSGDPDPNVSPRDIVEEVSTQVENGSIVIMHMNIGRQHTAEALPEVIRQLREAGYTFVTVSQLLGLTP